MLKILLLISSLALLAVGCRQIDQAYETRTVLQTNIVNVTVTNMATGEVTWVPVERIEEHQQLVKLNPQAEAAKGYLHFLPPPYGDLAGMIVGIASAIYLAWRNRSEKKLGDKVIGTLVDNIDTAKEVIAKVSPTAKAEFVKEISTKQIARGVQEEIEDHR